MVFVTPVFELILVFILLVATCELSGRLAYQFDDIDYIMKQFKWYLFPLKVRKNLPTILINAQQPVYFECIGSIPCDRETLKKVNQNEEKKTYSIYISFHK